MDAERRRIEENNEIIDHLEAAQKIIAAKCARCGGGGCMGCLFDSFDRGMIPALLDRAVSLMNHVPNERGDIVSHRQKLNRERENKWSEIASKGDSEWTANRGLLQITPAMRRRRTPSDRRRDARTF